MDEFEQGRCEMRERILWNVVIWWEAGSKIFFNDVICE